MGNIEVIFNNTIKSDDDIKRNIQQLKENISKCQVDTILTSLTRKRKWEDVPGF